MSDGIESCIYCADVETRDGLMLEIGPLRVSTLYLFKEQTYAGRCVVALRDHYRELFELPSELRDAFMADVAAAAAAIHRAFSPDKINYGIYGDRMPHVHVHLVPKSEDGYTWGTTFEMNPPQRKLLSSTEYEAAIARIREALETATDA